MILDNKKNNYLFVFFVIVLILIKHIITINLPIYIRDFMGADEYLMLTQAGSLIKGDYLGLYNCFTLIKGIGFPLFLTLAYKIGISYLSLYNLYYSLACIIALIPLSKMIKNKLLLLLLFAGLLFCPASFDNNVQLVYRNMLIIPQSIILVSSLMMMYYKLDESPGKLFGWSILSSLTWVFLWHTREDSIWSLPLVLCVIIILVSILVFKFFKRKNSIKKSGLLVVILIIPFISLFLSNHIISYINYKTYGIYTTNQLNKTNYSKAVTTLMKIKPTNDVEHVTITREALRIAYRESETFRNLYDVIEQDYNNHVPLTVAEEDNGEFNEDLITWELLGAASSKGYYETAQKAEEFWGKVYDELNDAIENNRIETRNILPSRSLIPYPNKDDSFNRFVDSVVELFKKASTYEYSLIILPKTNYNEEVIREYETITGAHAIRDDKYIFNINGYFFSSSNNSKKLNAYLTNDDGNIIKNLSFKESTDIYNYYLELNKKYSNSKKSRIEDSIDFGYSKPDNLYLSIEDENGKTVFLYDVINNRLIKKDKNYIYCIAEDKTGISTIEDYLYYRAYRHVRIANGIKKAYSKIGFILLIGSLSYYIVLSVIVITGFFKKSLKYIDRWLFLSAVLGSTTALLFGLGYVNAFMVPVNGYLSSSNGLLNLFIVSSIVLCIQSIWEFGKNCIVKNKDKTSINHFLYLLVTFDTKELFMVKSNDILIQFFRYIFVGGLAAVVNIGMLFVFTNFLRLYYIISNILSFLLGLLTNYILSKKYVFQEKTNISFISEFIIYTIIGVIGLLIDTLFIWFFTDLCGIYYMISKILSTGIVFVWNFAARKVLYKIIGGK